MAGYALSPRSPVTRTARSYSTNSETTSERSGCLSTPSRATASELSDSLEMSVTRRRSTTFDDAAEVIEYVAEPVSPAFPTGRSAALDQENLEGFARQLSPEKAAEEPEEKTIELAPDRFVAEVERRRLKNSVTSNIGWHSLSTLDLNMGKSPLMRRRRGSQQD